MIVGCFNVLLFWIDKVRLHYDLYKQLMYGKGFDDRAIHDICAITAYYAFVNRIADGLGVELESHNPSDIKNKN
jgi:alkylhydroperoxidase family enzyme